MLHALSPLPRSVRIAVVFGLVATACSTTISSASDGGVVPAADAGTDAASPDPCDAEITAPPAALGLAPFYAKYLDASGLPVASSKVASDGALRTACRITRALVAPRPEALAKLVETKQRVAVMARTEKTLDIPEHSDLQTAFPSTDWNTRARGLGGTIDRPATSCAEENLLCESGDPYKGENICVHELSHVIANLGVGLADATFLDRRKAAFDAAVAAGKWKDTYAGSNDDEYFAEGAQSYFDTNLSASPPNGIHNDIDTRAELQTYDPALFALVDDVFRKSQWRPVCPTR